MTVGSLQFAALARGYAAGEFTPADVVGEVRRRIRARGDDGVWITLRPIEDVLAEVRPGPLYGVPFAVKDNIDVAGMPTTAACPAFAYVPDRTAPLVERLLAAGALLIGKTNLDQFATGLSGTRSPYGACESPLVPGLISGGSSSGSAVAVSAGLVSFAIGTDTAGSGRVPAALTGVVGLKPSRGLVPTTGLVPACASLDCASVFALSVPDAATAVGIMCDSRFAVAGAVEHVRRAGTGGLSAAGPTRRNAPGGLPEAGQARWNALVEGTGGLRVGVPELPEFFGDEAARVGFGEAVAELAGLGHEIVAVDFAPFLAAGRLLYEGPWLAERLAGIGDFVAGHPDDIHPVTRDVLARGWDITGVDVFRGLRRLAELDVETAATWAEVDVLAVPSVPTTFTLAEMAADPIRRNSVLGHYSTFANLLDLAAIAVPAGMTATGRPHGLTLLGPSGSDALLANLARDFHHATGGMTGATRDPLEETPRGEARMREAATLAVVGAHRTGQPLHPQLAALGARCQGLAGTAPAYRLFDLGDRPGMTRMLGGESIEVELHHLTPEALGRLLVQIPAPLGLGTIELLDGSQVYGFLCESYAAADAKDITEFGSWPAYLDSRGSG
ncbi:allophanate hydrolase [Acrocarpospora macrocephala]|uniref:Allophanate hydrolase n=1 Tax=Acrocarpospora macrocephala TaxID=150177 RepID=A0A5M3WFD5_9ACTN|nr:allophanate hydrolase [Acrocarpospora macrocephala]GES07767.1 allophanate hydrolase [Acrocarpospora macrocephala]